MYQRIIILVSLAIAIPCASLFADFRILVETGMLPASTTITLEEHDVQNRKFFEVGSKQIESDGGIDWQVASGAGVYRLRVSGFAEQLIATANGEILALKAIEKQISVDGSPGTAELQRYEAFRKTSLERLVYPERQHIKDARNRGANESEIALLTQREVDGYLAHTRELNDFTIDQMELSMALYQSSLRWNLDYRAEELAQKIEAFGSKFGQSEIYQAMRSRIEIGRSVAIGSEAPELSADSPTGETLTLTQLKGSYVLVDFWASWCPPCRVENRHYADLLKRSETDSFQIFGVSLDSNEKAWTQAIARDRITWLQVSDLEGWQSPLARTYGVSALPASFLLDPEGRILAKNLRGPELDAKLVELGIIPPE